LCETAEIAETAETAETAKAARGAQQPARGHGRLPQQGGRQVGSAATGRASRTGTSRTGTSAGAAGRPGAARAPRRSCGSLGRASAGRKGSARRKRDGIKERSRGAQIGRLRRLQGACSTPPFRPEFVMRCRPQAPLTSLKGTGLLTRLWASGTSGTASPAPPHAPSSFHQQRAGPVSPMPRPRAPPPSACSTSPRAAGD
jgi:hypothetical protein